MLKVVTHQIMIEGKVYAPGIRDFSEKIMQHAHYKHFVKAGRILDNEEARKKEATPGELKARQEMEARYGIPKAVQPLKVADEASYEPQSEVEEAPAQDKKQKSRR